MTALADAAARELLDRLDPGSYVLVLGGGASVLSDAGHRVATDFDAGPFDAALAADAVLNESLGEDLPRLRRALAPGGLLVFDLVVRGREGPPAIAEDHDRLVLVRTHETEQGDGDVRITDTTTFRRVDASTWRRTDRTERALLHDPYDLIHALRHFDLAAHTLRAYAGTPLPRGRMAFVAD